MRAHLIFLLLLFACSDEARIQVTGAVRSPGPSQLGPDATVDDILTAAGGITDRAKPNHVYVIRTARVDSLGGAIVSHIPIEALESLQLGDRIHVPFRTFDVHIDSAVSIRNLEISHRDRRYRLGSGTLVRGYVQDSVQVAILLGAGTVDVERERSQSAGFHYLYARMHPGRFSEWASFTAGPATDPDAIEDARVIHSKLFSKAGHSQAGQAIHPPSGYLKIFAGVFPKPKSTSLPGPGMRRRSYNDGRVWTTLGDGRQRTRYPDGSVIRLTADGLTVTEKPSGEVDTRDREGNSRTEFLDGRVESRKSSGTHIVEYPDGRKRTAFYNGTIVERRKDGTRTTRYSTGTVSTRYPDGSRVNTFPTGVIETAYPNGRLEIITETGDTITRKSDGTEIVRTTAGEEIISFADGRNVLWSFYNHHANANEGWYDALNNTPGLVGPPIGPPPDDIRQYWRDWLDKDGYPIWSFWDNIRTWWAIRDLPNVKFVHFANLKADMTGEMRKIAAFLDIEIDESRWDTIVEYCTFDYMKANVGKSVPLGGVFWEGGAQTFINKGVNGRWTDTLTSEESAEYEAIVIEKLGDDCAHWLATDEGLD